MASTNINIRMDSDLKMQFEAFCADMGMTMTAAINIFAKKAVREYRIPFEIGGEVQRREKFFHIAGGSKQLGTARFLLVHNLNLNERIVVLSGFKNNGNYHRIALKVSFEKALYGALNELLRVGNVKLF